MENCKCLICPHCKIHEVNCQCTENEDKIFYIRAFRVDNSSECRYCKEWFEYDADEQFKLRNEPKSEKIEILCKRGRKADKALAERWREIEKIKPESEIVGHSDKGDVQ